MSFWQRWDGQVAMASRWRRRRVCELLADGQIQSVALRDISGSGARLDSHHPPALGTHVELRHPHAGSIAGLVSEIGEGMIKVSFDQQERAIAFALDAIVADMTRD